MMLNISDAQQVPLCICRRLPSTLQRNHSHPSLTTRLRHRDDDDDDAILYLIRRRHEARRRTAIFQFASLTLSLLHPPRCLPTQPCYVIST